MISRNCNGVAKLVVGQLKGRRTPRVLMAMAVAAVGWMAASPVATAATSTWIGPANNTTASAIDWNTGTNWTGGVPLNTNVPFQDVRFASAPNTYSSILSDNTMVSTVNSLTFGSTAAGTVNYNVTLNAPLTINSSGAIDVLAVNVARNGATSTVTISGPASLNVQDPSGFIRVNDDSAGATSPGGGTLTMANLSSFTASVALFGVGVTTAGAVTGQINATNITLPTGLVNGPGSSNITTPVFDIASGSRSGNNGSITLGKVNVIHTDTLTVGMGGSANNTAYIGTLAFNTTAGFTGSLTLAGDTAAGTNMVLGVGTSVTNVDFSTNAAVGGLNFTLSALGIGQGGNNTTFLFGAAGDTTSVMNISSGITVGGTNLSTPARTNTLDLYGGVTTANGAVTVGASGGSVGNNGVLTLGLASNAASKGQLVVTTGGLAIGSALSTGAVTLNNGSTANITGGVTIGGTGGTNTNSLVINTTASNFTLTTGDINAQGGVATITMASGTLTMAGSGNIVVSSGATANITISGSGTLAMGGGSIGSSSAPVNNFTLTSGTVSNAANLYTTNFTSSTGASSLAILGSGVMSIAGNSATLGGAGTSLTLGSGSTLDLSTNAAFTPLVSTLSLKGLTVSGASTFKFDLGSTASDKITLAGVNTLSATGNSTISLALLSGATPGAGSIPLITYNGTNQTLANVDFTLDPASVTALQTAFPALTFSLADSAGSLNLLIGSTQGWTGGATPDAHYNTAGNWNVAIPNGAGASANFPEISNSNTVVDLDVPVMLGSLNLAGVTKSYTIMSTSGQTLNFASTNFTDPTSLSVLGATHTISVPITLTDDLNANISSTLVLGGAVSGPGKLVITGGGTLTLATGNTTGLENITLQLDAGTLNTNNQAVTLGALTGAAGKIIVSGGSPLSIGFGDVSSAFNGAFADSGTTPGGALIKIGNGTLTLTGSSSYTGGTTLSAGTINISADSNLGATTSTLTFSGNGTLQAAVNNLTIARTISVATTVTAALDTNGHPVTINGLITGAGGINKVGTGTLTLTNTNNYGGSTTITNGELAITTLANIGSTPSLIFAGGILNLPNPTTIDINNLPTDYTNFNGGFDIPAGTTNPVVFSANLSGTGTFIKAGTSIMTISGNNSHSGGTQVRGGTLTLGSATGLGTGALTVNTGAALDLNGHSVTVGGLTGTGGTVSSSVAGTPITLTIDTTNNAALAVYSGIISDPSGSSLSLVKTGSGTATLGISNTYSGGTLVNGGTLSLSDNSTGGAHWVGTGGITLSGGGTLRLAGFGSSTTPTYDTLSNPITIVDTGGIQAPVRGNLASTVTGPATATLNYEAGYVRGTISGDWSTFLGTVNVTGAGNTAGDEFRFTTGANLINANVILNSPASITANATGTFNIGALSGNGTLGGGNSGAAGIWSIGALNTSTEFDGNIVAPAAITKVGTGNLTLTGAASTYIGGTVISGGKIIITNPNALGAGTGNLTVNTGGTLDLNGNSLSIGELAGSTGTITNSVAAAVTLNLTGTSAQTGYAGAINDGNGTTSLLSTGTGTTVLTGSSTYSGGTVLTAGVLGIGSDAALGGTVNPVVFTVQGASFPWLRASATNVSLSAARSIVIDDFAIGTLDSNGNTMTINGVISGQSPNDSSILSKVGTGTVILANSNSYSGGTYIYAGKLQISNDNALGNTAGGITFQTPPGGGFLQAGASLTINPVRPIVINSSSGGIDTNGFNVTYGGVISGSTFLKAGLGTLTLTGTSSTNFGTIVSQGLLIYPSVSNLTFGSVVIPPQAAVFSSPLTINATGTGAGAGGKVVIGGDAGNLLPSVANPSNDYRDLIKTGYNSGNWSGTAITSTTATAANRQGIGYMSGAEELLLDPSGTAFSSGYTVNANDALFRNTYLGDATLDGKLTVADYAQIDSSFLLGTTTVDWFHGDFNYDGVIDFNDYALIDAAFALNGGPLAQTEIDAHTAEFGAPYLAALDAALNPASAVPEPASLGLLGLGALGLFKRRRRNS